MQPYIPHDVLSILPFILIKSKKSLFSHKNPEHHKVLFHRKTCRKAEFLSIFRLLWRNTSVIEKIIIVNFIQTSLVQQKPHMPLKLLTVQKRLFKPLHDLLFLLSKAYGSFGSTVGNAVSKSGYFFPSSSIVPFSKSILCKKRPVF